MVTKIVIFRSKYLFQRTLKSRRALTINCLSNSAAKKDGEKWQPCDHPNNVQRKKMLGLCVALGVKVVMSNHTYMVGDEFYLQTEGGPIGLELTGIVARVYMMSWDKRFMKAVEDEGLNVEM